MKFQKMFAVAMLATLSTAALAEFPEKPVVLVVPFAAGGPSDRIARDVAEAMRKHLPQPVIVENAAGAGGTVGVAKVARSNADGYTLLVHHIGMATAPALYRKLTYKVPDDFEYLGLINESPSTVITRPTMEANNFDELRKYIAANPGKLNLAHAGLGSASHLCGLMLQSALKADMVTIAYKGTAPAMSDLLGGQVDIMCDQATNAVPQIEAGRVKLYAVTSAQRSSQPAIASAPTLAEAGLPGFNVSIWHGLYAPKGTPAEVLGKLNGALRAALKDPDFIRKQEALGVSVVSDGRLEAAGHKKFVEDEMARWSVVIKAAGQYAD
jgi:tripartite-type tricarboxylate transporter receptor subunit TctC